MILVLGATGNTGSAVLRDLVDRGVPVRGTSRTEAGADAIRAAGAEAAIADVDDPMSLMRAMEGVERLYLVTAMDPRQAQQERDVVSAAEQSGVYHCVKLGVLGQAHDSPLRFGRNHAEATDALQGSSLRWTVLLCAAFMQNLLAAAPTIASGQLFSSIGDARVAHLDARDAGAVAAQALAEEGHENCTYTLTGPEPLSNDDLVAQLGEVLGRDVAHVRLSDEEVAGALLQAGMPEWAVGGLVELWRDVHRAGAMEAVTPDVEAVLGRPATPFAQFASDHREVFASGGA